MPKGVLNPVSSVGFLQTKQQTAPGSYSSAGFLDSDALHWRWHSNPQIRGSVLQDWTAPPPPRATSCVSCNSGLSPVLTTRLYFGGSSDTHPPPWTADACQSRLFSDRLATDQFSITFSPFGFD